MPQMKTDIRDFMKYQYPTNLAVSPDGAYAAFAVVTVNEEDNCYDSCLWLWDEAKKATRKLTGGNKERNFTWIDNETILFTGNREKEYREKVKGGEEWTCFYTMNIFGGEAKLLAAVPHKVGKIQYQNGAIYAMVHEHYNKKEKDFEVFDEMPFWSNGIGIVNKVRDRLYRFDLATGEMKVISPEYGQVEGAWVENGTVFFACNVYTGVKMPEDGLYEYVESEDRTVEVIPQGRFSIRYACRRNGHVDFIGTEHKTYGYVENPELYTLTEDGPKVLCAYDLSIGSGCSSDCKMPGGITKRTFGDRIYVTSLVGTDLLLRYFDPDGTVHTEIGTRGSVEMFDIRGEKIWFIGMRDQGMLELYCYENGEETRLTHFNDAVLSERKLSRAEHFNYTYKGTELDGFVIPPVDYDPEKKYPGVLTIHGGPKGAYSDLLSHEFQFWASEGYFVFYTNPIGSDGRGNEFADIAAKQGSIDYEELMFFTDEVLRRYPAMDGDHLGVMGISYGGFMSNWIIGHTDRFKAAVPQCSIANWISKTNTTDIGYCFNTSQLGGDVWKNHDKMWELSPMKYADQIKTPALIIHCDEDYRCWLSEGVQMFSALQYNGVPSKLLLIHGESHGVSRIGKPNKRVRRLEEMREWFSRYLKEEQ